MFEDEQWRPVAEEKLDHYIVSDMARVKRADSIEARKISISDAGFPAVTLYGKDSKSRYFRQLNRLVAMAFLSPPFYSRETAVWHKDGDLSNCFADNLKWATRTEVAEWNEMHRSGQPALNTPMVRNNRTGVEYENAYECGMAEGILESAVVWKIERQARHPEDDSARYRYI